MTRKITLAIVVCVFLTSCTSQLFEDNMSMAEMSINNGSITSTPYVSQNVGNNQANLYFKEQSVSFKSSDGQLYGLITSNTPVLFWKEDGANAVSKNSLDAINSYLENESNNFIESDAAQHLEQQVDELLFRLGNRPVPNFSAIRDCEILQNNDDILSIRCTEHWFAGGTNNNYEGGITFNLKTGQVLSLAHFIQIPLHEFHAKITELMSNSALWDIQSYSEDSSQNIYAYDSYDEYLFFVSENTPYIIFPAQATSEADQIACWSRQKDGSFALTLVTNNGDGSFAPLD